MLSTYLEEINQTGGHAFIFAAPTYIDAFLNTASGAAQVSALSDPKQTVKEFASLWNIFHKEAAHQPVYDASAKWGEWGVIFFSMLGAARDFAILPRM